MKTSVKLFGATTLLALSIASAFAAETTTMKVQGKIVTAACNIDMPNGDVSDFSNLTEADFAYLDRSQNRSLIHSKQLSVTIDCPGATFVAIKTTDNNASSRPTPGSNIYRLFHFDSITTAGGEGLANDNWLGLGLASNGVPIGAYAIAVGAVSVDGNPQPTTIVSADAGFWQQLNGGQAFFGTSYPYVTAGNSNSEPVSGKTFSFPLDIALNINPASVLPANESLRFDASTTLEVVHL